MSPTEKTLDWVQEFVIRHALCPFAALPFKQGRVTAIACPKRTEENAFFWALTQVQSLVVEDSEVETTLLVFHNLLTDFDAFLDFVYAIEDALEDTGANALVQLAHFHPDYRFAGVPAEDPGNRTNRSPFPVVQLLRVESVAAAVADYPDVEGIPERNVERMREVFPV